MWELIDVLTRPEAFIAFCDEDGELVIEQIDNLSDYVDPHLWWHGGEIITFG